MFQVANLVFTDAAANKVKELIEDEQNPRLKLRVYITGGGCSGMQYGFTFDEVINDDDWVLEKNGVHLITNSISYMYLVNSEIDYSNDVAGERFHIRNPNAQTTCGCGSSFSAEPVQEEANEEANITE